METLCAYNRCHPRTPTGFDPSSSQKWPSSDFTFLHATGRQRQSPSVYIQEETQRAPVPSPSPSLAAILSPSPNHSSPGGFSLLNSLGVSIGTEQGGGGGSSPTEGNFIWGWLGVAGWQRPVELPPLPPPPSPDPSTNSMFLRLLFLMHLS